MVIGSRPLVLFAAGSIITLLVFVEVMNTEAILQLVDKPPVTALAKEVRERLDRVLAAL